MGDTPRPQAATYDPTGGTLAIGSYVFDGSPATWLLRDQFGLAGGAIVGPCGSGKTHLAEWLALGYTAAGCAVWYGDPYNGALSPWLDSYANRTARDVAGIRELLEQARQVVQERRRRYADHLRWAPDRGPGLVVLIEEAHVVLADPECRRLVAALSSIGDRCGVTVVLVSQLPIAAVVNVGRNALLLGRAAEDVWSRDPGVDRQGYGVLVDRIDQQRGGPLHVYQLAETARDETAAALRREAVTTR